MHPEEAGDGARALLIAFRRANRAGNGNIGAGIIPPAARR